MFFSSDFRSICAASSDSTTNKTYYIGDDGLLSCNIIDANIAWNFYPNLGSRDRIEISYENRLVDSSGKYAISGRNLSIKHVTFYDSGIYMCDSLDGPTHRSHGFNVTVQQRSTGRQLYDTIRYELLF